MKNSRIQFLFIFFISIFASSAFGIDYFWPAEVELKDGTKLDGVEVGEMSHRKLKKFFNEDIAIINIVKKNRVVIKKNIRKEKLTEETYTFDYASYVDEVNIGVTLARTLAFETRYKETDRDMEIIAIPEKYKVEDIKILNLERSRFMGRHKPYLDAIKNSGGIIPSKTAEFMGSKKDSLLIYEDVDKSSRFAIIGDFVFLDKKPVFYNYHGFSPFVNESRSIGFLLKVDGKEFLLAEFRFSLQKKGWVEEVEMGYFLVNLDEGKGYLPMHLREEK